jgi:hypothetical protein
VPDEFPVHISRRDLHAIEIPASFETDGSFDVVLVNHGTSLHVHLHLDDTLSTVAALDANNHYVEGEDERGVRITVDTERIPDDGLFGRLKIVSAYGSETRWVDIELAPPEPVTGHVRVDESLSTPPEPEPNQTQSAPIGSPELPVLAFGGLALLAAIVAAVVVRDTLVTAGAAVVVGGVAVALFVLRRG